MKLECDIVKDLLPLYVEHLTSQTSSAAVEEHLETCETCKNAYLEMKAPTPPVQYSREPAESFSNYVKKKKRILGLKTASITALVVLAVLFVASRFFAVGGAIYLLALDSAKAQVQEDTDVSHYLWYMGDSAKKEYVNKWGMDETIFPETITNEMDVTDYKMVYYNPWDKQFLSYLAVNYDEESYEKEVKRLKDYASTDYLGNYGADGFSDGYTLLAMESDPYYGFVYALSNQNRQIVYVELIFCNYFMDLDYETLIPAKYLPIGFDATVDNPYRKQKLGHS